jgi:hypothetical protein
VKQLEEILQHPRVSVRDEYIIQHIINRFKEPYDIGTVCGFPLSDLLDGYIIPKEESVYVIEINKYGYE